MILANIRRLCRKKGISINQLEIKLGLGNGTITKWDKSSPKVDNLKIVADYFKVSVDSLLKERK